MNDKETVRYSGTIQITLKNGNMTYNMDVNKVKVADATIVQPTIKPISYESPNASSSVNRSTMNDMKECFPFLDQYYTTLIMCTFSDGHSTVDAYKFVQSDLRIDRRHHLPVVREGGRCRNELHPERMDPDLQRRRRLQLTVFSF